MTGRQKGDAVHPHGFKEGGRVWIPSSVDPYGHDPQPGQLGVIDRIAEDGSHVTVEVGGDPYDFNQFPPVSEIYGAHPEAAGGLEKLVVLPDVPLEQRPCPQFQRTGHDAENDGLVVIVFGFVFVLALVAGVAHLWAYFTWDAIGGSPTYGAGFTTLAIAVAPVLLAFQYFGVACSSCGHSARHHSTH